MSSSEIEEITAPAFIADLTAVPLVEVRARRDRANEIETGLSYLRRLVQGHLDIVMAEQHRREAGEAAGDVSDLVRRLPAILGEHVHAPGSGRLPTLMAPGGGALDHSARLEAIVPLDQLSALPELSDADLHGVVERLDALEREVSGQRRGIHEVLDYLQAEIVRRYRTGEATVDNLLR